MEAQGDGPQKLPDLLQALVAAAGMLLIGALYLSLPDRLTVGPSWLPIAIEGLLVAPLILAILFLLRRPLPYRLERTLALLLLGVVTVALIVSLTLWVAQLPAVRAGPHLLRDGASLWAINALAFAVWYWEVDGGGPLNRLHRPHLAADLLFPQQQAGNPTRWMPGFIDYLFVAFCFSTALSPADTAPLSRRAKLLMMAQASLSLTIIVLLIGRSANILG